MKAAGERASLAGPISVSELGQQLEFERLTTDLVARFVHLQPEEVDAQIGDGLRSIVEALSLDRSTLLQFSGDADHMAVTHSYALPGLTPIPSGTSSRDFPWALDRIQRGEAAVVSRLGHLPKAGTRDQEMMQRLGVKSTIIVPLAAGGKLLGAVAFGSMRAERSWPAALVPRLRLLADIFAGALERKSADMKLRAALEENQQLRERLQEENAYLREVACGARATGRIVGQSAAIQSAISLIEQVAPTDAPVLLLGETGVGKELLAEALHAWSSRCDRTMVKVNCATLPASLVESELFGREKGAYTGALTKQIGRFELAHGGTLFLDEIAELPPELQSKLLRVLQKGEFERLGSPRTIRVDVRIVAATNRDIEKEIAEHRFRNDLFYRLAVFPVFVPPLRERPEDIPLLVQSIVDEVGRKMGKRIDAVARESLERLARYPWPGNIRELRNVVERAIILSRSPTLVIDAPARRNTAEAASLALKDVERRHIAGVLERTGWRVRGKDGAAALLGLPPTTLETRMASLEIRRPASRVACPETKR
jgi:transcriptional regulator with GAF, ATPase, and Fis domain